MNEFNRLASTPSDIHEHMLTLVKYAKNCESVAELGVRNVVSAWAWVEAKVKVIHAYDFVDPEANRLEDIKQAAKKEDIAFTFYKQDVLKTTIPEVDLLFIDTLHVYQQLKAELALHANKARKYIILHDTTTYAHRGEDRVSVGLLPALYEFLEETEEWDVLEVFTNCNGLTILQRI